MKNFDEFSKGIKINESEMRFLNENETELSELGYTISSYLEDHDIDAEYEVEDDENLAIGIGTERIEIQKNGDEFSITSGTPAKVEKVAGEDSLMLWWSQFVGSHKAGEAEYKLGEGIDKAILISKDKTIKDLNGAELQGSGKKYDKCSDAELIVAYENRFGKNIRIVK